MNREEAIEMWVIPALKNTWNEKKCDEILEALEQEPCTVTEFADRCMECGKILGDMIRDAVSRKEVMNMFHNHAFDYATSTKISALLKTMRGEVDRMPPVTPAEKVGHWEWVQYDYNPKLGDWHCSECRSVVVECVDKNEKGGIPMYKYCPQCGIKMKEVDE